MSTVSTAHQPLDNAFYHSKNVQKQPGEKRDDWIDLSSCGPDSETIWTRPAASSERCKRIYVARVVRE